MSEEDFTKLYRYFDKRFVEAEKQFDKVIDENNKL
jgi:hypothetical protein